LRVVALAAVQQTLAADRLRRARSWYFDSFTARLGGS